jgi:hypothetical protein
MRTLLAFATLTSLLVLGGCARSATSPSGGSPSGTPEILGTSPSQPSLSDASQVLTILGHDFETGMIGTWSRPDGLVLSFVATDFKSLSATSFQLSVTLNLVGDYRLEVKNLSGETSSPFTVSVLPAAQGALTLISVSPTTAVASNQQQALNVSGTNFDSTLEAILTAPDSSLNFYNSAQMAGLSSSSFALNVILDKVGTYSLVVQNGSNSVSNALTIDVRRTF